MSTREKNAILWIHQTKVPNAQTGYFVSNPTCDCLVVYYSFPPNNDEFRIYVKIYEYIELGFHDMSKGCYGQNRR